MDSNCTTGQAHDGEKHREHRGQAPDPDSGVRELPRALENRTERCRVYRRLMGRYSGDGSSRHKNLHVLSMGQTGSLQSTKRPEFPVPTTPWLRAILCGCLLHRHGPLTPNSGTITLFPWSLPIPVQAAWCLFTDHLSGRLHSRMRLHFST